MRLEIVAVGILCSLALGVAGVVLLNGARKRAGWALVGGSVLVGGLAILWLVVPFALPDRESEIWVTGLSEAGPNFHVELAHTRISANGKNYSFSDAGPQETILDTFSRQHPGGTTDISGAKLDGLAPLWRGPHGNITVTLYGDGATFKVVSDVEYVLGSHTYKVPLPSDLANPAGIEEGVPFSIKADAEAWRAYYSTLKGSSVSADGITVPTSDGHFALITVAGNTATLTPIADNN